tara:strand:+ start:63651 stop:63809 length:159 start_codon:yes stop_codon:yes gene_type:complete
MRNNQIDFPVEHYLQRDVTRAFGAITTFHGVIPIPKAAALAEIDITTPADLT